MHNTYAPLSYYLLTLKFDDSTKKDIEQLKEINKSLVTCVLENGIEEKIELFEKEIILGYKKIEILESYISNLQEIIDDKEKDIKMKSKCNKIFISYTTCVVNGSE